MEKVYTKNAPDAIGPYSQAVKCGNLVFTSGQIATQTMQVCENLKAVLEASGTSLDKAVKTVCFLDDMEDFAAFNAVYGEYFKGKPARSCVEESKLSQLMIILRSYFCS